MTTVIAAGTRTTTVTTAIMIVDDELRRGGEVRSAPLVLPLIVRHACLPGRLMIVDARQFRVEYGARVVSTTWTVKDSKGQVLPHFIAASRLEVARKVVPTRYDAFRLQVSSSYREMFNRDLKAVLEREAWHIVPIKRRSQQ
jgi:hypothetical protein